MRVSPISISQYKPVRNQNLKHSIPVQQQTPNFKGWGGGLGSTIGTFAGLGMGAVISLVTGGLTAPLLLAATGCYAGGLGGEIIEDELKKS